MKVLRTDNFPTEDPDECFVEGLPVFANTPEGEAKAKSVADAINKTTPEDHHRRWTVVEDDYKLNQKL